ncbi:MAG: hypothetical protein ACJAZN_000684 [Planctomycetota bacterium]|jgi:hypothetical protein
MTPTTTPRHTCTETATWTETATERLLDVATMAIAYLYWQICEIDGTGTSRTAAQTSAASRP